MTRFICICLLFSVLKFAAACHSEPTSNNLNYNLQSNSTVNVNQNLNVNSIKLTKYQDDFYRKGGKTSEANVIKRPDGELTVQDILDNRNKSIYVLGGHFNCSSFHDKSSSQIKSKEKKARDFLWKYWSEKRRAYFSITYSSPDATSTGHIFIEPDEQGKWHILWRWVRDKNEIDDLPEIVLVKQVRSKISKDLGLQLIDQEGEVSRTFPDEFYNFED